jgi:glycosyltransferase involved in cell wall biosynthesis
MLETDLGRLKGRRLFVGTPMYDGKCHSEYAFSLVQLTALCTRLEIDLRLYFACHDALITKARDVTVDEFLKSGDDNLIFIDADIGFDPRDVIRLLAMQVQDEGGVFDIVAAPYPTKRLSWDRVLSAAKSGVADDNPALLANYSSAIAVSPAFSSSFPINEPVEVTQAGTGFMIIRRETFERFRDHYPARSYSPNYMHMDESLSKELYAFFETEIDSKYGKIGEEVRHYLARNPAATAQDMLDFLDSDATMASYSGKYFSEDYAFCRRVREAGMKVWLCPWMALTHTGSHRFSSRLADLGAIGAL